MAKFKIRIVKIVLIAILIIYVLYIFQKQLFRSSPCSHLYNTNQFTTCAALSSLETCNITVLLNAYLTYRSCAIEYSRTDVNYVVFDAVNGLGNRILGLIAVTTYALVTGRVLLINWRPGDNHQANFNDLFLPLSSADDHTVYYSYSLSRLVGLIRNKWMNEIETKVQHSQIPNDWAFYFDRTMLCDETNDNQSWFVRLGFYILNSIGDHVRWIRTDQYFVPLLTRNTKTRQAFMTLFPDGQVFNEIARKILHPVPKVTEIIDNFQSKYNLENRTLTIGVHMRTWSPAMIDYVEPFYKCLEHVIQNISKSDMNRNNDIYLYIISNTRQRRQQLEDRISRTYTNIKFIQPPNNSRTDDAIEIMQYTLAELLLLSKMKYLIITSKSTFGMIAQGLAHNGAWIVRQGVMQEPKSTKSDICEWESTSEPEYQMLGSLKFNDRCISNTTSSSSAGERTIL